MSGFLCDTQVVIWAAATPKRLRTNVRSVLADPSQRVLVSSVSIAEMVIKQQLGKLVLPLRPQDLCAELGFAELALSWNHSTQLAQLPTIHRDPFDRLLISQALVEELTLITADDIVASYPDVRIERA